MSEHEREPASIPGALTDAQAARVWYVLDAYWTKHRDDKSTAEIATSLGYSALYVCAVLNNEVRPSVHFASAVARLFGVDLETLLNLDGGAP